MPLAKLAIRQPIFISMVLLAVTLLGGLAYSRMGVDLYPDISNPVVSVTISFPGASPEDVETLVTKPVEQAVRAAELEVSNSELEVSNSELELKSAEVDLEQAADDFRKIAYPYTFHTVVFDVPEALVHIIDARKGITKVVASLKTGPSADMLAISIQLIKVLDSLDDSRILLKRGVGDNVFGSEYRPVEDFWTMRAAQLQRDKAQLAVDTAKNDLDTTRNDLDTAKNDLDRARDELDKAVIIAPFDGVITKVNVKEGDFLSSATLVAIEIIDPVRMELDVKVNELDIPNVNVGQKVTISVDALPDVRIDSVVTSINPMPVVESGVVSYDVKVFFHVPHDSLLKAGMRATAKIIADKG